MDEPAWRPDVSFDGGDLDCGNGLLLLIRKHIDPLPRGGLLEIRSRELSVREDLPAWCRMTGNDLVDAHQEGVESVFLVCKGTWAGGRSRSEIPSPKPATRAMPSPRPQSPVVIPTSLPSPVPAPDIPALAVMGIGSWPRPTWLVRALHEHLEGRMSEDEFQATADDAVRLAVQYQLEAGVDVVTDGEQRRDNYASFVGGLLDNCQLIPLADLLPYVDDPQKFAAEMEALDIPAMDVRHPAVFGKLGRSRSLAVHEATFVASLTSQPLKVALPGPYLLARTMWMECISDRAYATRDNLAADIVRVLREELHSLLHAGVALVQFDEPVLTEVAYGSSQSGRTFMCGALGEKLPLAEELQFALDLYRELTRGLPWDRIGLHICRGNWTRDESVALAGNYQPLLKFLQEVPLGNYFLELCTPRAGELDRLRELPLDRRIGVGVVNQKRDALESVEQVARSIERAVEWFGPSRVWLTPDCGFATFADRPLASTSTAKRKLEAIVNGRKQFLGVS